MRRGFFGLQREYYLRCSPFHGRGYIHASDDASLLAEFMLPLANPMAVTSMALSPTAGLVLFGCADGCVHVARLVWEDPRGQAPHPLLGHCPRQRLPRHARPVRGTPALDQEWTRPQWL